MDYVAHNDQRRHRHQQEYVRDSQEELQDNRAIVMKHLLRKVVDHWIIHFSFHLVIS